MGTADEWLGMACQLWWTGTHAGSPLGLCIIAGTTLSADLRLEPSHKILTFRGHRLKVTVRHKWSGRAVLNLTGLTTGTKTLWGATLLAGSFHLPHSGSPMSFL